MNAVNAYLHARDRWAVWARRAAETGDRHAEHVTNLCAKWMAMERESMQLHVECCAPVACYRQQKCMYDCQAEGS